MIFEHSRVSTLALALVAIPVVASGCVSKDDAGNTAGSSATAGSSGTAGSSASGGSSSGGSSSGGSSSGGSDVDVDPLAVACPAPTMPLITDFTFMDMVEGMPASKTDPSFGDFTTTFSGGGFVYPGAGNMYPLTSDVTEGNWHISGDVGNYSGFALFFNNCFKVDASAYKGISFTVSGEVEMGGTLTFLVGTAADDITSAWLNMHKAEGEADKHNFGRCTPATDNQYDGSCGSPTKSIPVTADPTVVTVLWKDLTSGKPQASVTPSEITSIAWSFPAPAGAGTDSPTVYKADVVIDDLTFVE